MLAVMFLFMWANIQDHQWIKNFLPPLFLSESCDRTGRSKKNVILKMCLHKVDKISMSKPPDS